MYQKPAPRGLPLPPSGVQRALVRFEGLRCTVASTWTEHVAPAENNYDRRILRPRTQGGSSVAADKYVSLTAERISRPMPAGSSALSFVAVAAQVPKERSKSRRCAAYLRQTVLFSTRQTSASWRARSGA